MRKSAYIFSLIILCSCYVLSDSEIVPDTIENRETAAKHYLKVVSIASILNDAVSMSIQELPQKQREKSKISIMKQIRSGIIKEAVITALVSHFTVTEIKTLTELHNSLAGRSIMNKLAAYADDVVPPIQEEIMRAISLATSDKSRLFWSKPIQEFTTDITAEKVIAHYEFINRGSHPVTIKSVGTSCGCTTTTLNKKVYRPGESGKITAIFNTEDRVGNQSNLITVITDDADEPMVVLKFRVKILELLKISPRFLYWQAEEKVFPKIIKLSIPKEPEIKIVDVESSSGCFEVKPVDKNIPGVKMLLVIPKTTSAPCKGKIFITAAFDSDKIRRFSVFLRILPSAKKKFNADIEESWNNVLWIDTRSQTEYNRSHITGAILLNKDLWEQQIESVLDQWTPNTQIVIYCRQGCYSYQTAQRLREYGLTNIYIMVSDR